MIHLLTGVAPIDLPHRDTRIQFRDRLSLKTPFIDWLEVMTETAIEKRYQTARQAREALGSWKAIAEKGEKDFLPLPEPTIQQVSEELVEVKVRERVKEDFLTLLHRTGQKLSKEKGESEGKNTSDQPILPSLSPKSKIECFRANADTIEIRLPTKTLFSSQSEMIAFIFICSFLLSVVLFLLKLGDLGFLFFGIIFVVFSFYTVLLRTFVCYGLVGIISLSKSEIKLSYFFYLYSSVLEEFSLREHPQIRIKLRGKLDWVLLHSQKRDSSRPLKAALSQQEAEWLQQFEIGSIATHPNKSKIRRYFIEKLATY